MVGNKLTAKEEEAHRNKGTHKPRSPRRHDEYSSKIFSQLRNQGMSIRRGADKRLKVMLDSLVTLQQGRRFTIKRVSVSSASSNVEPAHNTTKYFVPNLR
jgi:hypothetical protein